MRRIFRLSAWVSLSLIGVYLVAAVLGGLLSFQKPTAPSRANEMREVILVAGPIHYDILLPLDPKTREAFAPLQEYGLSIKNQRTEWLLVGWGAHEFYTKTGDYADVTASAVWRAITGDRSVMRVDTIGRLHAPHGLPTITLHEAEYDRLISAVSTSFKRNETAGFLPIDAPGFNQTDQFFEANGRFHIFRTCNTWIARVLRASGARFGIWTPTPFAVTLSLRRFHST